MIFKNQFLHLGGAEREIDVYKYTKFKAGSVFREIPMITDQTMATILLIDSNSMTTDLNHPRRIGSTIW